MRVLQVLIPYLGRVLKMSPYGTGQLVISLMGPNLGTPVLQRAAKTRRRVGKETAF